MVSADIESKGRGSKAPINGRTAAIMAVIKALTKKLSYLAQKPAYIDMLIAAGSAASNDLCKFITGRGHKSFQGWIESRSACFAIKQSGHGLVKAAERPLNAKGMR